MSEMINLEGLIQATEKQNPEYQIPLKELCQRYEKLFTAAVNDALREKGILYQTLPNYLRCVRDGMKIAGPAFTIKGSKNLTLENEMEQRAVMLEAIYEDCVVAWDTSGDDESAQWGEVMTMAAKMQGCRGAVVDGGVRDLDRVLPQDFPVFVKYRSSNGMLGRFRITAWETPIRIGNATIRPGDIIFADIDGALVVPHEIAYDILIRSEAIVESEGQIKQWVMSGMKPREVVERGGYF